MLCSTLKEVVHEADLAVDTFLVSDAVAVSDHVHNFEALDGGCCCAHRLETSGRLEITRLSAMICLNDVVQVFRCSMLCARRKLTATLEALDRLRIGAELVYSDR